LLSRAGALDPAQAEVLRGELDGIRDEGGEAKGADVVGEIADILEDLREQRVEQGKFCYRERIRSDNVRTQKERPELLVAGDGEKGTV
jgi:hypothetical protein